MSVPFDECVMHSSNTPSAKRAVTFFAIVTLEYLMVKEYSGWHKVGQSAATTLQIKCGLHAVH